MSDLTARITEILGEHRIVHRVDTGVVCSCGNWQLNHPEHVAALIAGLFRQEWAIRDDVYGDIEPQSDYDSAVENIDLYNAYWSIQSRYVTDWEKA